MWIRKIFAGTVVVVISGSAAAQGAFSFDDIPGVDQEPSVTVNINPFMIGFIREIAEEADPQTADLLRGLRSLSLRVYNTTDNRRQLNSFIDDVTDQLESQGWMTVVSMEDAGSRVHISMQMTAQEVSGMTIMMTEGSEAIFMNIDGSVSAQDLGKVLAALPVDAMMGSLDLPQIPRIPQSAPPQEQAAD